MAYPPRLVHGDLARPRRLTTRGGDLQDPVAVLGIDTLGVKVVRQAYNAPEIAVESLPAVVVSVFVNLYLAASGDAEQVLLDRQIQALRIQARGEDVHIHALGRRPDIKRRKSPSLDGSDFRRPGRSTEELVHLAFQTPEFVKDPIWTETHEQIFEHGLYLPVVAITRSANWVPLR